LLNDHKTPVERHKKKPFLNGTMAACALVAIADGEASFSERIRVDQIINALHALKVFDPHEAVDILNRTCDDIIKSPKQGRETAVPAVRAAADTDDKATLMVRIFSCTTAVTIGAITPGGGERRTTQVTCAPTRLCAWRRIFIRSPRTN